MSSWGFLTVKRLLLGLTAVLSLAFAAVAVAAQTEYKVTGGGQVLASAESNSVKGPGDTITFQAFVEESDNPKSPATGQVNIIDRMENATTAKGKGTHVKGTVECAFVAPESEDGRGYAELYGTATRKDGRESDFVVRIQDNGQGNAAQTDLVEFDYATTEQCGDNEDEEKIETFLGRGNAKIHKASPSQSGSAKQQSGGTSTRSTSLTSALR